MANHKSAKKRAKQSIRKCAVNKSYLSKVRTLVKSCTLACQDLKEGKVEGEKVASILKSTQSILQKAAAKGIIHKNKASRSVGRLTKLYQSSASK